MKNEVGMNNVTEETLAKIRKIRHVVMDMDGTIYRGKQLFPTTKPFLELLDKYGIGYTFLTNNSSRSKKVYLDHLEEFGIHIQGEQMYTSTVNTVQYLQKFHPDVKRLFMLGTPAFREEMVSYGFCDVNMEEEPQAVVTAFDTALAYERLCKAAWWIKHDKLWIATHPDLECPPELETTLVDCGSITACLECVSKKKAIVLGKPNKEMIELILDQHGLKNEEVVMCGDRMYTDIQLAVNSKVYGVLISDLPHEKVQDNIATWTMPHLGILGDWIAEAHK